MTIRWPKCDCVPECGCLGHARVRATTLDGQVRTLRDVVQEQYSRLLALEARLATLDSEREANAMLTAEVEMLRNKLATLERVP